jgi:hypothetical protein
MRILVASTRARPVSERLAAFAAALARRGHDVTWVAPGEPPAPPVHALSLSQHRPERTAATLALTVARDLLRHRPQVALLRHSPGIAPTAAALVATRVPLVLDADDVPREPDGLPPEGEQAALAVSTRAAASTLASSAAAAARLQAVGGRAPTIIADLVPLPELLPGGRHDARAALGLPLDQPIIAHVGPLEPYARLELLAEAHRHAAGVGLLMIAEGSLQSFAHAMTLSTRPSSPVLVLTPEAAPVALWAADVLVWLGPARARAVTDPLALGRRVVVLEEDAHLAACYPAALRAVHVAAAPTPRAVLAAVGEALAAEAELGPLPSAAVSAARHHLDQHDRLVELLEAVRR